MPRTVRLLLLTGIIAILCLPSAVRAQSRATTADLVGVVTDSSQAVLPGVTVTATNADTNLTRSATTDDAGRFALPALPPGVYNLRAELGGFAAQTREQLTLHLGDSLIIDFVMPVAGQSERVTVTGDAPVVDTQRTAVATVVTQRQIEDLPINGRNFISFSVITPGVSTDQTPQQGASATSGLTFAGQRARSNNITVDGLDNNDSIIGSVRAVFSQEAVREFQVLTNSYSAEFGKATGGVVNIVTKSGTNMTSGNAFLFFRDESLNAKNHFEKFRPDGEAIDRDKAPYSQKQFGGTLGGPIVKNRTFYFASFERLDVRASNFVTIDDTAQVLVPTPAGSVPVGTAAQILQRSGFPLETGDVPYDLWSNAFMGKVDHQFTPNQSLTLRYTYGDGLNENIEPFGGQVARSRAAALDSKDHMFTASQTSVLSSRWVNELRFQFARRDQLVRSLDPTCDGECDREDEGGPTVELIGVASVGRQRFTPQPRLNDRYQILDTISFYTGRHQLKAGFDFNYIDHKVQSLPLHFGGRYIFSPFTAAQSQALGLPPIPLSSIQAFALGIPARYVQGYGDASVLYGYKDLSLFVQDDWRVTDRLTVKAGLRYQNQYWPDFTYTVSGYPTYGIPKDNNNVAPRLAAAWDPKGDQRTSIHGAYGLFFDNHITSVVGIARGINGDDKVRTLVVGPPTSVTAWRLPGRKLPQPAAAFPSLEISIDPGMETPYAHHASAGIDRQLPGEMSLSANFVYVRGSKQLGTIDYNPTVAALGPNRRPEDINGIPLTSAPILQYTSFGETWYRGLTVAVTKRFTDRYQFLASYTLSKAEDNSTDYQTAFIAQDNGRGRDPNDPTGLPIGFDPDSERGLSTQDQRHRFVLSGLYVLPGAVQVSSIITLGSGRPFNILAGVDLNQDGDGGSFPADRARTNPLDQASSVARNVGEMPTQATVDLRVSRRFNVSRIKIDGLFEVFNLFNRTNYIDVNNIFGTGVFPSNPAPGYGQFTQAGSPLQVQLAAKVSF